MSVKTNPAITQNNLCELRKRGFTEGLVQALLQNKDALAKRIWIVDNSSSMRTDDGHCIISTSPRHVSFRDCTRWEEIQETVVYHMELAELIQAPTEFRLLNMPTRSPMTPQRISIATDESSYSAKVAAAKLRKVVSPFGCTPLTHHINDIHEEVSGMEAELRRAGKRVAIVIATDGLPTDLGGRHSSRVRQLFVDSLRALEGLPVWLVIRLSTDDDDVVEFYNELDNILELSIDVLDDFSAEAKEVYENNPWINYALPLHRMREMGFHDRLFDLIDQSKLSRSDIRDVCALILGDTKFDGVPDPAVDWAGFINSISHLVQTEEQQWNPIKKRQKPWISINRLNRVYGKKRWF
jgi:hypothetical protein